MTQPVSLLLGVHAHQPVGNFPEVLHDAHLRCYQPFIRTLHRYPDFRFSVHFSGWLLDWMLTNYPDDMALLREMVKRGQVELFGAGDTEPVLAVIPNADRIGQLNVLSDKLQKKLGQRPQGAWLTERVWEATVVPALSDAGIRYVTVDDYHFLCAGKAIHDLDGYYTTEEDGRRLDLFPISESLRYRLPFSPAEDAVNYIESLARREHHAAAIYFDDIEKFGIWPETYAWVYERGWLVEFIERVLASPRIRTAHYSTYHAAEKTRGVVYLPTTSYIEMNEWTLPAPAANEYAGLVQAAKSASKFERHKAFLRGGIWKNFFTRYPESNWMHKRMLQLSARYHALPEAKRTTAMRNELYDAQANDAYWHGLFGGLYLPHLRRAVYNALVRLEALLDRAAPRPAQSREDFNLDGVEEVFLHNAKVQVIVPLDGHASVGEFDARALAHNFGDSLCRQTEHYYRKLNMQDIEQHAKNHDGIASAHDRVAFKHEIFPEDLEVDSEPRALFVDRLNDITQSGYAVQPGPEDSLCFTGNDITKTLTLQRQGIRVGWHFGPLATGTFSTRLNIAMPSCDGPAGRFVFMGNVPGGFGQTLDIPVMQEITLDDDVLGGSLVLRTSHPVHLHAIPHFSVSQSEAGFEKIMQAVTLTLSWPAAVGEMEVSLEVSKHGGAVG